jgi:hypothetical protein
MDALDIIVNPYGAGRSYLGVYHINIGQGRFALRLATSPDLTTWRKIADLDATRGGMGTLRALPDGGFLLAYEAQRQAAADTTVDSNVRLRYYRDAASLASGVATEQKTLPHRLSTTNEGTPNLRTVVWRGSLSSSLIRLGFHYLDHGSRNHRTLPVDRQARGTLDAGRWSVVAERRIDRAMSQMGFHGNHGGRRDFTVGGRTWRIYEAQQRVNAGESWRLLLYDVAAHAWTRLDMRTPGGSKSFANPIVNVLASPTAPSGQILVVTLFIPGEGAGQGESGEVVSFGDLGQAVLDR